MDARTWLRQMYDLERYKNWLKSEKKRVEELRCSLPSLAPNDARSPGNVSGNARYVDIIARTEKEMDGILARLAATIEEQELLSANIYAAAKDLQDPKERDVILHRYCHRMTSEQTAQKMHYSVRHVKRIHARALTHIKPTK